MEVQMGTGIKVTGLDQNERVRYKGTLQSGEVFIIIEAGENYHSSRVFFQKPGEDTVEAEVIKVRRSRDSERTKIKTERGSFHFASPLTSSKTLPLASFSEVGNDIQEMEQ